MLSFRFPFKQSINDISVTESQLYAEFGAFTKRVMKLVMGLLGAESFSYNVTLAGIELHIKDHFMQREQDKLLVTNLVRRGYTEYLADNEDGLIIQILDNARIIDAKNSGDDKEVQIANFRVTPYNHADLTKAGIKLDDVPNAYKNQINTPFIMDEPCKIVAPGLPELICDRAYIRFEMAKQPFCQLTLQGVTFTEDNLQPLPELKGEIQKYVDRHLKRPTPVEEYNLALKSFREGQFKNALSALLAVKKRFEIYHGNSSVQLGKCLSSIASCYRELSNYEAAKETCEQAKAMLTEHEQDVTKVDTKLAKINEHIQKNQARQRALAERKMYVRKIKEWYINSSFTPSLPFPEDVLDEDTSAPETTTMMHSHFRTASSVSDLHKTSTHDSAQAEKGARLAQLQNQANRLNRQVDEYKRELADAEQEIQAARSKVSRLKSRLSQARNKQTGAIPTGSSGGSDIWANSFGDSLNSPHATFTPSFSQRSSFDRGKSVIAIQNELLLAQIDLGDAVTRKNNIEITSNVLERYEAVQQEIRELERELGQTSSHHRAGLGF